jgi:predicted nucleotidyltransferase
VDSDLGLIQIARRTAGLRLLVLYGSRARGDDRQGSDWDFGYLANPDFDPDALLATLAEHLRADRVDLVDLAAATGQLRYRVARDGRVLVDGSSHEWSTFWMAAVGFWCDAGPVIAAAYADVLEGLGP